MESYEQAVDLALLEVNLDKSIYHTMIRSGLKNFLNSQYKVILQSNSEHEMNKFILASKILLNDLQSIPVNSCPGRECSSCMVSKCDKSVNYKTPVYEEALIDPYNISNSNITKFTDGFNPNTFNPVLSRISQPLDTLGLYQNKLNEPIMNFSNLTGYGPLAKVQSEKNLTNQITHPIPNTKKTLYNQYYTFNK